MLLSEWIAHPSFQLSFSSLFPNYEAQLAETVGLESCFCEELTF